MSRFLPLFALVASLVALCSCNSVKDILALSPVVAGERWVLIQAHPGGISDTAVIRLKKHADGLISSEAVWHYDFNGNAIDCDFMSGTGIMLGSVLTVKGDGKGYYVSEPAENSTFKMTFVGDLIENPLGLTWAGFARITFSDPTWDSWAPDSVVFAGVPDSGSGVTH